MTRINCGFNDTEGQLGRELLIEIGPTIKVDIGFDPDFDYSSGAKPALQIVGVAALIDTGAAVSCIDASLAMRLGLPTIDQAHLAGVGGKTEVNLHLAQIHAPDLQFTLHGEFAGVFLTAGGQRHDVLLGRDFLRHFRLEYDGPTGAVVLIDLLAPMEIEIWPDE